MLPPEVIRLKVTEVIRETADTISIKFVQIASRIPGSSGSAFRYKAGQFVILLFHINGKEVRRSYSLSSSPEADEELCITVKRIVNGEISRFLFGKLKTGDLLEALSPNGRFTITSFNPSAGRDFIMVTAGSGITPVYSIIKSVLLTEPLSNITLIYANRKEETTIFYEALKKLERSSNGKLKCIFIFSNLSPRIDSIMGHLNKDLLQSLIDENIIHHKEHAEFYLCGPWTFMRMAGISITAMGFEERQMHMENFVITAEQEALNIPPFIADRSEKTILIRHSRGEVEFSVPPGTTILNAALKKGINLPYSCQSGICGSCAAKCTEGEVIMSGNQVLTAKDLKEGWVLTCTGYPASKKVGLEFKM